MEAVRAFRGKHEFLSNFYPSKVVLDGEEYQTVEAAFQAAKTFSLLSRNEIRKAKTPGQAKKIGRRVVLRPDWESVKIDVMRLLLSQKFVQGSELADRLIETGDAELVEGNSWHDTFWGVCDGVGENHLGRLLMEVRLSLRSDVAGSA